MSGKRGARPTKELPKLASRLVFDELTRRCAADAAPRLCRGDVTYGSRCASYFSLLGVCDGKMTMRIVFPGSGKKAARVVVLTGADVGRVLSSPSFIASLAKREGAKSVLIAISEPTEEILRKIYMEAGETYGSLGKKVRLIDFIVTEGGRSRSLIKGASYP